MAVFGHMLPRTCLPLLYIPAHVGTILPNHVLLSFSSRSILWRAAVLAGYTPYISLSRFDNDITIQVYEYLGTAGLESL